MEILFLLLILLGIVVFLALFTYFVPIGLWITAFFAGVRVSIFKDLVGMRLRKVPPSEIFLTNISCFHLLAPTNNCFPWEKLLFFFL